MNGVVFVIFGYAWCVAQISSATKQYETNVNEGIGYAVVNLKEGVSDSQIYSRNRRDNSKDEASYIFFDNRSDRMVELWWMDKLNGKKYKFMVLSPGETIDINSYNTHQWSVIEKYTRKSLLINKEKVFSPQPNEPSMRTILIIGRSEQTDTKIPEKFIEAMVVVDKSVIELLGRKENVTRYILTLLRMSTKVFQHQSLTKLGVKLTHVLSKLVLLDEDVNEIRFNSDDGEATFLSICSYMNKIESSGSVIFDQKIFLTKRIFGKVGYSYGKGMCRRGSNCALIFNDGFSSALNIAHETGHALGMNDRRFPQGSPFVMSGIIFARFNNYDWCRSSQISLLRNIRMKHCLDNKPSMYNKDFPFVHKYPGVHYSILKQCHLKYNMNYSTWPYQTDQCKWLTCRMPPPWTTQANRDDSHLLDGTKCGTNKWCLSGVCQKRTEPIVLPTAIHGNWGEWKAWKPCSRTCGAGISTRERECNNPLPIYGGNFCVGIAVEVRVCNTGKNCPDNPSKEEVLCSETGANTGRKRQWGIYDEAKVNVDCNFESDANAWCNWTNEIQTAQQDWKLNKGKTRSSNTGPSVDHTTNTDQGQYIYFESSSPESERGYKARLSSSKLAVRQACLSFWYHMFGNREMGSLRVIQKSQGASKTLWHKTGNQGQTWLQAKVEIQDDNLYQIFFEAEKLISGYHSDIALDDITFTSGACGKAGLQISTTTDTRDQCSVRCTTIDNKRPQKILLDVPVYDGTRCHYKGSAGICYRGKCTKVGCDGVIDSSKKFDNCDVCGGDGSSCKSNVILEDKRQEKSASDLDCDFNNDLCQWNNVKNNASDVGWSRKKEKSYNQGHYLYLETSSSQRKGKFKAKIVSPEVGASKACLSFDYKMNVNKLGKLKVKLLTKSRQFASLRWFKKGSQGNMWKKAKIYIKKNVPYKVVLEAIVINQQHGNVAIDNVQFLRQNC